ncbi:unnamed protein product [Dovyalis caffra]|uniref:Uncharacterized protein n=1 Tax=Dovyalis caffra TaxID=77055 RepID=A0AAV1QUE1_9ROSI|nr:unnamed protein product [Dovyalis caffra]
MGILCFYSLKTAFEVKKPTLKILFQTFLTIQHVNQALIIRGDGDHTRGKTVVRATRDPNPN